MATKKKTASSRRRVDGRRVTYRTINTSWPATLLTRCQKAAAGDSRSFSNWLQVIAAEELERRRAARAEEK